MSDELCEHLRSIRSPKSAVRAECEECAKTGDSWVHLRVCQGCGATLCCDSSPNRHASRHAGISGHPVICSAEPGERWLYCFVDQVMANY